ncbi:MAG: hypothetical protein ACKVTZ_01590, partial [Bacteroidia bacterium]
TLYYMEKSKKKAVWGWFPSEPKVKASSLDKPAIELAFQEVLETLQEKNCKEETPENDASLGLYTISVGLKWHRHFLYICYNQRDAREGAIQPYWEDRTARIECTSNTTFNLAYFRHTGQWATVYEELSLADTKSSILNDPCFCFV